MANQSHAGKLNCPHCLAAFTIWDIQPDEEHVSSQTVEDRTAAQANPSQTTVVECPSKDCGQRLRLPKTNAVLRVRCPECGTSFAYPPETAKDTVRKVGTGRIKSWFMDKARRHPLFLGLLLTVWSAYVVGHFKFGIMDVGELVIAALLSLAVASAVWLLGVWVLDKLREEGVAWYFRKWFTLLMLFLFTPLGITLLWVGSRFRRPTKVALTMGFGLLFLFGVITRNTETYHYGFKDTVAYLFRADREDVFLEPASNEAKAQLWAEIISGGSFRSSERLKPQEISRRWGNSIVEVICKDKDGNRLGEGSGFIIGANGAVATNYHVVQSAHTVSIQLTEAETYEKISLVSACALRDIAVLQIEGVGKRFSPVALGDSDTLEAGERVVAIGNPMGLEKTVTTGDVSAIRHVDGHQFLQISAPISPGSSGGALFNLHGEVVGITTLASYGVAQNLNFAVPINSLKSLIREALSE